MTGGSPPGAAPFQSRQAWEEHERQFLSPGASLSSETRGRQRVEEPCQVRTAFQRDRDRIIHSKAFRRLKGKTQVFIAPGDHDRTRMTHTLEVAQISRTVSRGLGLNEDLTEAIALGHDLGHTPFGHAGEEVLDQLLPEGFRHAEHSRRVVDVLASDGKGLNLTWEVRDGIANHSGAGSPATLEGQVVKVCDRVAYINHDIDDAIRSGLLRSRDLPQQCLEGLGHTHSRRIDTMVKDLIRTSAASDQIRMSPTSWELTQSLRTFLFQRVYQSEPIRQEVRKAKQVLRDLYDYYLDNPGHWAQQSPPAASRERTVADYLAGMTDRYAVDQYRQLFLPKRIGGGDRTAYL